MKTLSLRTNLTAEHPNPAEDSLRPKAMYVAYFEPWDWIIAASSYRAKRIRGELSFETNPSGGARVILVLPGQTMTKNKEKPNGYPHR